MEEFTIVLSQDEATRLQALAAHEGFTPEKLAAGAVRARLAADAEWEAEVRAAMAEADAGDVVTWDQYCADMDSFIAELATGKPPGGA